MGDDIVEFSSFEVYIENGYFFQIQVFKTQGCRCFSRPIYLVFRQIDAQKTGIRVTRRQWDNIAAAGATNFKYLGVS